MQESLLTIVNRMNMPTKNLSEYISKYRYPENKKKKKKKKKIQLTIYIRILLMCQSLLLNL